MDHEPLRVNLFEKLPREMRDRILAFTMSSSFNIKVSTHDMGTTFSIETRRNTAMNIFFSLTQVSRQAKAEATDTFFKTHHFKLHVYDKPNRKTRCRLSPAPPATLVPVDIMKSIRHLKIVVHGMVVDANEPTRFGCGVAMVRQSGQRRLVENSKFFVLRQLTEEEKRERPLAEMGFEDDFAVREFTQELPTEVLKVLEESGAWSVDMMRKVIAALKEVGDRV